MFKQSSVSLHRPFLWQSLAWFMLASTVWITLTPSPPQPDIEILAWDKAQHTVTYAWLMWWCGQAFERSRVLWAPILFAMGCILELLQQHIGTRHMEFGDMVANGAGVLVGVILMLTPIGRTLELVDGWLWRGR